MPRLLSMRTDQSLCGCPAAIVAAKQRTIVENGALFAAHQRVRKTLHPRAVRLQSLLKNHDESTSTLRTSVGEFAFKTSRLGCQLELVVGRVRRALGFYHSSEAALHALKKRRTGFCTWDSLERGATARQIKTLGRGNKREKAL